MTPNQTGVSLEKMDDIFGVTDLLNRKLAADPERASANENEDSKGGVTETRIEKAWRDTCWREIIYHEIIYAIYAIGLLSFVRVRHIYYLGNIIGLFLLLYRSDVQISIFQPPLTNRL